jgi:transposase
MMGDRKIDQAALFYEFSLERHVPGDHMLQSINRFVDLEGVRAHVAPFYSAIGRPSLDPELLIRMLLVGYCFGIRSERRLCEEVHLNLGYRWFCRLGLDGDVPDHSTFSKNRHGRFRDCDLLRQLFETVVSRCIAEGLVGGEGFAVDASLIKADANRQRCVPGDEGLPPEAASRAISEYLAVLDDAAFGGATSVVPKFISPADPAARWTAVDHSPAYFAYATNYLIDLQHAVIVDVEATTAVRQAEVGAARTMIERVKARYDLWPERLAADTADGSAPMLDWLVHEQGIEPHKVAGSFVSRCSTNPNGRMGPSRAPTSPTITPATPTPAPPASCCGLANAPTKWRRQMRRLTTPSVTAPPRRTAMPVR